MTLYQIKPLFQSLLRPTMFWLYTWDLRAPAPTPSHLRATVAIKGSFRGAEF